jgi:Ni,Fe-hydrogenase III component G
MPEPAITNQPRAVPGEVTTFQVAARYLEDVACDLADLRLADMFASDGDEPTLRLVWANDTPGQAGYVITETRIDGGRPYPALSDIAPAAFVEECEIYEQFGVRPATGREPNRIRVTGPGHAPAPSPWNWSGCTTMPPRWWRCARPSG